MDKNRNISIRNEISEESKGNKPHSKLEVDNYIDCLNMITDKLLINLDDIGKKFEQYFQECSVLGVDRLIVLKSIRKLLKDNQEDEREKVENFQGNASLEASKYD